MNRSQRVVALGDLGERTVLKWFNYHGKTGTLSESRYDTVKDMMIEGVTVEVKTLMPIFKYNAFCLPLNQKPKCDNVGRLIFVKVPHKPGDPIELYESPKGDPHREDFREWLNHQQCIFYRLTSLKKLGIIHDQEVSREMWELSPSKFKGNDEYKARVSASA